MEQSVKVVLLLGQNVSPSLARLYCDDAYVVGVDAGAIYCLKHGIRLDEAVGDFDSISHSDFLHLMASGAKCIKLPIEKDVSDTEYALALFPKREVLVLGGISGKRIEHALANFSLLKKYPNATFLDDNSKVFYLRERQEVTVEKENYRFLSVFPQSPLTLRAEGLYYPYPEVMEVGGSLGVSNEFQGTSASLKAEKGSALIILSRDDGIEI